MEILIMTKWGWCDNIHDEDFHSKQKTNKRTKSSFLLSPCLDFSLSNFIFKLTNIKKVGQNTKGAFLIAEARKFEEKYSGPCLVFGPTANELSHLVSELVTTDGARYTIVLLFFRDFKFAIIIWELRRPNSDY